MTDQLNLRAVTMADAEILLAWRNDPNTRQSSHNSGEIGLDSHRAWLEDSFNKPEKRCLWIAEIAGVSVGTCRADRTDNAWALSWTVAPEARGKGVAHQMLSELIKHHDEPLVAEVKVDNIASIKVAERAGFVVEKEERGVLFYKKTRESVSS